MFGASGVVAIYGVGCLLACAIIAIGGVPAPGLTATVRSDVEYIRERTHR
jgi:hypothetical protein